MKYNSPSYPWGRHLELKSEERCLVRCIVSLGISVTGGLKSFRGISLLCLPIPSFSCGGGGISNTEELCSDRTLSSSRRL